MKLSSLSFLREGWLYPDGTKRKALRSLTVRQGLSEYIELYETFRPQLDETEKNFRHERKVYLARLQERLRKLSLLPRNRRGRPLSDHI